MCPCGPQCPVPFHDGTYKYAEKKNKLSDVEGSKPLARCLPYYAIVGLFMVPFDMETSVTYVIVSKKAHRQIVPLS